MRKKTVVFDFDGVIHSYTSGWKGAGIVEDPVVPGIQSVIKELREKRYEVVVVSARCSNVEGMDAVKQYLEKNDIIVDRVMKEKPPAICYIDDRAICFDGKAETLIEKIRTFRPWNRQIFPAVFFKNARNGINTRVLNQYKKVGQRLVKNKEKVEF